MFQGIPSLMIAGTMSSGGGGGGSTLLTGLNAYYKLEDVTDSSGNALNLTNNNGVTFTAGKVNNGANFVSASVQSLTHASNSFYDPGLGDFSVSCWFNFTNLGGTGTYGFVANGDAQEAGTGGWELGEINDKIIARIGDGTNNTYVWNSTTSGDTTWHFMVATFSRVGNMTLYQDNISLGTSDITAITGNITSSFSFWLGNDKFGDLLTGSLDEVGIWNRVITGTEITHLWNGGSGITYPF